MTTLADVREAMAAAITAGCGLRMRPYASDNITAPEGHIDLAEFDPRMVFDRETATYPFRVRVFVKRPAERSAQVRLDELREVHGPTSLRAAVENDENWPDDLVQYVVVTNIGAIGTIPNSDEQLFVVDFQIEVCF